MTIYDPDYKPGFPWATVVAWVTAIIVIGVLLYLSRAERLPDPYFLKEYIRGSLEE